MNGSITTRDGSFRSRIGNRAEPPAASPIPIVIAVPSETSTSRVAPVTTPVQTFPLQGVVYNDVIPGDRFGYSVSPAGDFNSDGAGDILVGAPATTTVNGGAAGIMQQAQADSRAPVGHRQPRPIDIPGDANLSPSDRALRREDDRVDNKLVICRGC